MGCGVGHRCGLDLALLWLWCRPAATAPIRPLAWETPYATGCGPKKRKRKREEKENILRQENGIFQAAITVILTIAVERRATGNQPLLVVIRLSLDLIKLIFS